MEHTTNYHLPQFEETDRIHHDDFNDAFSAIDTALAEKPYVIGTYTGDGVIAGDGGQHITLGFRPHFLIISGFTDAFYPDGYHFALFSDQQVNPHLTFTDDGFTVHHLTSGQPTNSFRLNTSSRKYCYIAFR